MRRLCAISLVALLIVALAGSADASSGTVLKRDSPPAGGGYTVLLPSTWRFANASYPSDHITHLWFDPANALRKLLVVVSGCVCSLNGRPDPSVGVPANPLHVVRVSPTKDAFQAVTGDDPWVANGLSIDILKNGRPDGYASVELWLPPKQRALATRILASFRIAS